MLPLLSLVIAPELLLYTLDSRTLLLSFHSQRTFEPDNSYRYFQDGVEYEAPAQLPQQGTGSVACYLHLRRPLSPRPPAQDVFEAGDCEVTLYEGGSQLFLVPIQGSSCRPFIVACYRRQSSTRTLTYADFEQTMRGHASLKSTQATIESDDNLGVTDSVPSISGRAARRSERRRQF